MNLIYTRQNKIIDFIAMKRKRKFKEQEKKRNVVIKEFVWAIGILIVFPVPLEKILLTKPPLKLGFPREQNLRKKMYM